MATSRRAAVVGAGPVGLFAAHLLAERGWEVAVVDPDPGPPSDGSWRRKGVMQFWHPHLYRTQIRSLLTEHAPQLLDALFAAGVEVIPAPEGAPPGTEGLAGRRPVFEAALRGAVLAHPRITHVVGTAARVRTEGGRVTGLTTDAGDLDVDLVIGAGGRTSRLADELRPPTEGGPCGVSYVARMYRAKPGHRFDITMPANGQTRDYQTIIFCQDAQTVSVLFVRPSEDDAYRLLWQAPCFDAAAAAVPNTAPWVDPARFEPITDPMRGGTLTNTYRGQGDLPAGLVFVGDAVCTTNPSAGRGITLGMWEVIEALRLVDEYGISGELAPALDAWSEKHIKPWYDDHVVTDSWVCRRYAGDEQIDFDAPLPTGVLVNAAFDDPSLLPLVGPYLLMFAPPASLARAEPLVKDKLRAGWLPPYAAGPSRDELIATMEAAALQSA